MSKSFLITVGLLSFATHLFMSTYFGNACDFGLMTNFDGPNYGYILGATAIISLILIPLGVSDRLKIRMIFFVIVLVALLFIQFITLGDINFACLSW